MVCAKNIQVVKERFKELKIEIFYQEEENHRRKYLFARNYYCCKYKIIGM